MTYGLAFTGITLWVYLLIGLICLVAGFIMKLIAGAKKDRYHKEKDYVDTHLDDL